MEQTEKRLKTTRAPSVTSCLDILVLKYNDSSNRGCKALLMTNILMEAVFHHLCCRCILKGGISGVSVPGTPVQVSSCSTDVTAPPLCSVKSAVIAAVWKFGLTVLI